MQNQDSPSGYGGSEDDRARELELEIISVIGSPNGSESVIVSMSQVSQPAACSRVIDWFSVGSWSIISDEEALKNCE